MMAVVMAVVVVLEEIERSEIEDKQGLDQTSEINLARRRRRGSAAATRVESLVSSRAWSHTLCV